MQTCLKYFFNPNFLVENIIYIFEKNILKNKPKFIQKIDIKMQMRIFSLFNLN